MTPMGWDAGSIESSLDVDLSPFHHGLERAKAEAREFADKRYTTTVDINTRRSQDELSAVEQRLHSIESSIDRIGHKTGGGGGAGGRGGMFSRMGNLPNPSWLGLGLGAAIPAAIPFAGLAGGIAGGALSAGVTGGLGLGAFGLGAKQNIATITGDITKLTKLTGQYNAATTNKQRAAVLVKEQALWKSLDPAQRAAVKNVQALDSAWASYKKKLEPQTFAVVADGAKIANTGLKYLLPTAQAVGDEIDDMAKRAEHAFKSPFWHQFFGNFLPGEAARSVDALGTTLGNVGTGVGHLVQDFAPLAHLLEGGSTSISARFEKWTEGAGPGKFVAWVEKEGPPAAKALEGIATGVEGLVKGLAPIGGIELKALTPVLNFIGKLGDEHPAVITAVGGALLTVGAGLKAIKLVGSIPGIGRIGGGGLGGGGGILGKGTPVPVYVTNWGGVPGEPHGPGGPVRKIENLGKKIAPYLPASGRVATAGLEAAGPLVVGAGVIDLLTRNAPKDWHSGPAAAANLRTAQQDPAVMARYQQLLAGYQKTHPAATLDVRQAGIQNTLIEQAIRDVRGLGAASAHSANDIDNEKHSLAGLRSELAQLGPATLASLNALARMPGFLRDAQAAALNGGFIVGANLKKGIIVGFQSTHGTVQLTNISQSVNGRTQVHTVNAKLAGGGPTTAGGTYLVGEKGPELFTPHTAGTVHSTNSTFNMLGEQLASALALGFAGFTKSFEKVFSKALDRQINGVGTKLNNAANQYRSDLTARSQLGSQISGGLMSGASIANASLSNTGGATVGGYLGNQLQQMQKFAAAIKKLRNKHLDPRLLQQIIDAGPQQGLMLAQEILSGESISSLNKQETQIAGAAGQIGSTVAGATFAGTLSKDRQSIARLATAAEHLLAKQLHLSASSSRALAREIAHEFNHAMPYLNLKELGHAAAIRIYAS